MHLRITVPNQHAHLRKLADAIDDALLAQGIDRALRDDVRLIAEEIACNAVGYGYDTGIHGEVVVAIDHQPGTLVLEFRDDGRPFDPLAAAPPELDANIDERPIGGLGLHLVRELARTLSYAREEPYNVLRVTLRDPATGH